MTQPTTPTAAAEPGEQPPRPCVGSGLCCKTAPCPFGVWDQARRQCAYLEVACRVEGTEIYRCGRYAVIRQQPGAAISPAFGAGCCMPLFNDNRVRIIRLIAQSNDPDLTQLLKEN